MLATSSPRSTEPEHWEPVFTPLGLTAYGAHGRLPDSTADHPEGQAENSVGIHRAAAKTSASRLLTGSPLRCGMSRKDERQAHR
ncbi:hypothetical protein MG293_000156 [Ovis ammon polii]|uniref:Uncharacterized protein n=1 Tax=Ovis ammon polii TaxID=230172 RepID=A0AAD4YI76_OVIAM|nr:hypothetical protein MG293_000156 [Ovis ammon polii]